ncbi:hypothetical protein ACTSKR_08485 [Chitinibacteraceae bacterium HSL-7]
MNSFELLDISRVGMNFQHRRIELLARGMVGRQVSVANGPTSTGKFSHTLNVGSEPGREVASSPEISYVSTVTSLMDAMRMYQVNLTVANAAKSMIERSLEISGK